MPDPSLLECERIEIAGIPAYVAEGAPQTAAALVFRVGQADEPLPRRGLTHLVEHLVLSSLTPDAGISGQVGLLCTTLAFEDRPDVVAGRLRDVATALGAPPVDRLDVERRVLSVESGSHALDATAWLLQLWFGARGPGLAGFDELGLRAVTPEAIVEHARRWFCRENAALVVVGPVAPLEDLELRPGTRRPPAPATPRVLRRHPAAVEQEGSPVALGAPVDNTPDAVVLAALLERRAWKALRHDRGLAYDVDCTATVVDAAQRLLVLTCDAAAQDADTAATVLVEQVRGLANDGSSEAELAEACADIKGRLSRADALPVLVAAATSELVKGRPRLPRDVLAELDAVDADAVAAQAAAVLDRMLVTCPPGSAPAGLETVEPFATEAVAGTRHKRRLVPRHLEATELVVGDTGVSAIVGEEAATVLYEECAAAIREFDGGLTLIGLAGNGVTVDPADIRDGAEAVARVEAALDPELLVGLDDRTLRVQDGAARKLRPMIVGEAGELLAPLLGREEALELALEATQGLRSGVLAITDRRLLFVSKVVAEHVQEIRYADIARVRARRNPLFPSVVVDTQAGSTRFGFMTVPRAQEAARAIGRARG